RPAGGQLGRLDFLAGARRGGRGCARTRRRRGRLVQRALDAGLGRLGLDHRLGLFLLRDEHLLGGVHHHANGGGFGFGLAAALAQIAGTGSLFLGTGLGFFGSLLARFGLGLGDSLAGLVGGGLGGAGAGFGVGDGFGLLGD